MNAKKLIVTRSTRLDEDIVRPLKEIEAQEGLLPAQVDREFLTWCATKVAKLKPKDQALRRFLQTLRVATA